MTMSEVGSIYRDIEKPEVGDLGDYTKSVRLARILTVYDYDYIKNSSGKKGDYGSVDLLFLDGPSTVPVKVPFLTSWFSWTRGAGVMFMPEQNDIVACLERQNGYPLIIGFLPYKWDETISGLSKKKPTSIGYTHPLNKGEVFIKSSSGGSVFINQNGTVEITGADSSLTEEVFSGISGNNRETSFSRVKDDGWSCVAKTIVGNSYLVDGASKFVGNAPQILESGTSTYYEQSLLLPNASEVSFYMTGDTEIVEVKGVYITYEESGTQKTIQLKESQYTLSAENVYTPGSQDPQNIYYKPATTERNTIKYTLKVPVYNFSKVATSIVYLAKHFVGGIRVNSLGDLFLDGRNVVVRSQNESSTLTLGHTGNVRLRGSRQTKIGNIDGGQVSCTYGGVQYSQGAWMQSKFPEYGLEKEKVESALEMDNPEIGALFYVSDTLPLIKLVNTGSGWDYKAVTVDDYKALSDKSRANVQKIAISPLSFMLSEQKLAEIMKEEVPTYGELKGLR